MFWPFMKVLATLALKMAWIYLFLAGLMEIVFALSLKYNAGFTKPLATIVTLMFGTISLYFLSQAIKILSVGTAYAIWTGIGVIGTAILGIVLFNESRNLERLLCIGFIVVGIAGLKFTSN